MSLKPPNTESEEYDHIIADKKKKNKSENKLSASLIMFMHN